MTSGRAPSNGDQDEGFWRQFLTRGPATELRARGILKHVPGHPRCKLCAAPFAGAGAPVMRLIGKRRAEQNPNLCRSCYTFLSTHHGGAEIDVTMLFADIRGSTTLAEGMSIGRLPPVSRSLLHDCLEVVFAHDGMVDKFVGDELVAMFFPLLTGERHADQSRRGGPGPAAGDRPRGTGRAVGPTRSRRSHRADLVRRGRTG